MDSVPTVSICLPTYGRAKVLPDVIASVINQTYRDFELFICDDASPDNTVEVVKAIADSRIRYYRHQKNLGVRDNWNYAIKNAYGKYIFKLDDDDYLHPEFIAKTISLLETHPNVGSVYTGFYYTKKYDGEWISEVIDTATFNGNTVNGIDFIKSYLLRNSLPGYHHSSVVFRYNIAKEIGFYEKSPNDIVFSLALASVSDVGYIPEALFYYVQHDNDRATTSADKMQAFFSFDPAKLAKNFFELDFVKTNRELQAIKHEAIRNERNNRSGFHLFISRINLNYLDHAKVTFGVIHRDWHVLLSPVFLISIIVTFTLPKFLIEKFLHLYKSNSFFKKIYKIILSPSFKKKS